MIRNVLKFRIYIEFWLIYILNVYKPNSINGIVVLKLYLKKSTIEKS